MKIDIIKNCAERAPHPSLLRATGSIESDDDFNKPFIAIANSYTDCIPGHAHLNEVGLLVKRFVRAAGGVPFIFNTINFEPLPRLVVPTNAPPFLATTKVPSTKHSCHISRCRPSNWRRNARHNSKNTPPSIHSVSRSWTELRAP
jgi:hypothetical protein